MSWLVADLSRCILKDATVKVYPALVEGYSFFTQLKVCGHRLLGQTRGGGGGRGSHRVIGSNSSQR
jgi:hypothetical protein